MSAQGIIVRASNRAGYAALLGAYDHLDGRGWLDATWIGTFDSQTQAVNELERQGVEYIDVVTEQGIVHGLRLRKEGGEW